MDAHASHDHAGHDHHGHGGSSLSVAISATLHCLTGCAIGEIAGMAIGTGFGLSNFTTIVLSIALAFVFGYTLTSLPLLRAGFAVAAVVPIALASDTLSITTMEIVDNLVLVVIPGALHAGLGDLLFWGSLAFALALAFVFAVPVNKWLIERGKGHAVVHETGVHGGPPIPLVAAVTIAMAIFGTTVLVAEAISGGDSGGDHMAGKGKAGGGHGGDHAASKGGAPKGGETMRLELGKATFIAGKPGTLTFVVKDAARKPVRNFDIEQTKRLHLIVVRRDLTGFQHLHPRMAADGTWSQPLTFKEGGGHRVFADFTHKGKRQTLASDIVVAGRANYQSLPPVATTATTDGYKVALDSANVRSGRESALRFTVTRNGNPVALEPYLGAAGHLVAIRKGDLNYLHVHPVKDAGAAKRGMATFNAEFPSAATYRLFLQFKQGGKVHTATFTAEAG
jgi:hypothetical protein